MKMPVPFGLVFALLFTTSSVVAKAGSTPTRDEMNEAQRWTSTKFAGQVEAVSREPGLHVVENHDPVQRNNRNGKPMRLGDQQFTRGLYCPAQSKILVRLPGPGKTFTSTVGVDRNEDTSRGTIIMIYRRRP